MPQHSYQKSIVPRNELRRNSEASSPLSPPDALLSPLRCGLIPPEDLPQLTQPHKKKIGTSSQEDEQQDTGLGDSIAVTEQPKKLRKLGVSIVKNSNPTYTSTNSVNGQQTALNMMDAKDQHAMDKRIDELEEQVQALDCAVWLYCEKGMIQDDHIMDARMVRLEAERNHLFARRNSQHEQGWRFSKK